MSEGHELAVERVMDVPVAAVWRAITERIADWWCPRPWTTEIVGLDWRAGGRFAFLMHGPAGEAFPVDGVLLELVPERRIVFTNLIDADWTVQAPQPVGMIGIFTLSDLGDGRTDYRAASRHASAADAETHRAMGFEEGWSAVAAQLEDVARSLA